MRDRSRQAPDGSLLPCLANGPRERHDDRDDQRRKEQVQEGERHAVREPRQRSLEVWVKGGRVPRLNPRRPQRREGERRRHGYERDLSRMPGLP